MIEAFGTVVKPEGHPFPFLQCKYRTFFSNSNNKWLNY